MVMKGAELKANRPNCLQSQWFTFVLDPPSSCLQGSGLSGWNRKQRWRCARGDVPGQRHVDSSAW